MIATAQAYNCGWGARDPSSDSCNDRVAADYLPKRRALKDLAKSCGWGKLRCEEPGGVLTTNEGAGILEPGCNCEALELFSGGLEKGAYDKGRRTGSQKMRTKSILW